MNKIAKFSTLFFLGATMALSAADTTTEVNTDTTVAVQIDIDTQIEQIKNANPQQRHELMNRLKQELATMNREERMEAISKLREGMHALNAGQMAEHANEHAHNGAAHMNENMERMKGMAENQQAMQMQHSKQMEQMHQQQGVDQYMHSDAMNAGGAAHHGGGMDMPFGSH